MKVDNARDLYSFKSVKFYEIYAIMKFFPLNRAVTFVLTITQILYYNF